MLQLSIGILIGAITPELLTAQTLWYDITMAGKVIGSVQVFPVDEKENSITRTVKSTFSVPLLYSGKFESTNKRVNGTLVEAETIHSSNGRQREKTVIQSMPTAEYKVAFYKSDAQKPASQKELGAIYHTLTDLYFQEPTQMKEAYSERYGEICKIKPVAENQYAVDLPTGKTSIYTYWQGICQEVELELSGVRLKIVKRDKRPAARE